MFVLIFALIYPLKNQLFSPSPELPIPFEQIMTGRLSNCSNVGWLLTGVLGWLDDMVTTSPFLLVLTSTQCSSHAGWSWSKFPPSSDEKCHKKLRCHSFLYNWKYIHLYSFI